MARFEVAESIVIDADATMLRAIVGDFDKWAPWSPWLSAEPDCKLTFATDGTSYTWDGDIIGSGAMRRVREDRTGFGYKLTFLKPWKSTSDVAFDFEPAGASTRVTWRMVGSLPFFMFWMKKMMCAWISADYRRGLAKLKDLVETGTVPSRNEFPGFGTGVTGSYIGIRHRAFIAEMGNHMPAQLERLNKLVAERGIEPVGPPMAIYHSFDIAKQSADYTAAILVSSVPNDLPSDMVTGTLNAPRTYRIKHTGAYRHLSSAWSAGMMHQRRGRFDRDKSVDAFEIYVSEPSTTPEVALVTEVHLPAR